MTASQADYPASNKAKNKTSHISFLSFLRLTAICYLKIFDFTILDVEAIA